MAELKKPEPLSGFNIEAICPPGQYVAVCLTVQDLFGVTRRKFQSQEQETKDVTRFVFGVIAADGRPYLLQTYEMTIAATPGSNLIKFLTSWIGRVPDFGWDYCDLKGTGAMISVQTKQSNGVPPKMYSTIAGIFPVPAQMLAHIPAPGMFSGLLAAASAGRDQQPPVAQQPAYQPQMQAQAGHYANPQALATGAPPVMQQPQMQSQMQPQVQPQMQPQPQMQQPQMQPQMQPQVQPQMQPQMQMQPQQPVTPAPEWDPNAEGEEIPF